jgi:hypothetical protein
MWAGAIVLGVAAWSMIKPGVNPGGVGNTRSCCPLLAVLDAKPVVSATSRTTTNATARQVVAYYFHGTVRCETCLMIEQQAKTTIEQQFSAELTARTLVFLSVNYELPENRHFMTDYKLPCPSLVLVRQKGGKEEMWKLLEETWQLVHDPIELNKYVEAEVSNFLSGQETRTNKVGQPAVPKL